MTPENRPLDSLPPRLVEGAKLFHIAGFVIAALLLVALFGIPAVFGHETLRWVLVTVLIGGTVLVILQTTSVVVLWLQKRRVESVPRLVRPASKKLQFDETQTSTEGRS